MQNKKTELSEQDLHIIHIYSKKNPADTIPQFGNPNYDFSDRRADMQRMKNQKNDDYYFI